MQNYILHFWGLVQFYCISLLFAKYFVQNFSKRTKLFEYLKNNSLPNYFVFLQKTHSSVKDEKQWSDSFKGQIFYSHDTTNFCGVAIAFLGSNSLEVVETKSKTLWKRTASCQSL